MENNSICPICKSKMYKTFLFAPGFDNPEQMYEIVECLNCFTIRTMPFLKERDLKCFYKKEYYGTKYKKFIQPIEFITLIMNKLLAFKIHQDLKKLSQNDKPKVLDIGCGRGNLLLNLNKKKYDCYGIEREGVFQTEVRNGIKFFKNSLIKQNFPDNYFDCIIIWHVLEHMINPDLIIKEIFRILKPSGKLWISVPNIQSFQAILFKKHWFHLDLPRHRFHFSLEALENLLKPYDFIVENISTFFPEQNIYGFIQSGMNSISFHEKPQLFYEFLKKESKYSLIPLVKGITSCVLYFIIALIELIISTCFNKGAVLILKIKKNNL